MAVAQAFVLEVAGALQVLEPLVERVRKLNAELEERQAAADSAADEAKAEEEQAATPS